MYLDLILMNNPHNMTKQMIRQFLTPPRIGRRFETENKTKRFHWEVEKVIKKMSHADNRYEIIARLMWTETV